MSSGHQPRSRVFLHDMNVAARIGAYDHERHGTQPLIVDVDLTLDTVRLGDEDLNRTVDYDKVAALVRALAVDHIDLVETFAERLAGQCLAFDHVDAVRVRIRKPQAVPDATAGVELVRVRAR